MKFRNYICLYLLLGMILNVPDKLLIGNSKATLVLNQNEMTDQVYSHDAITGYNFEASPLLTLLSFPYISLSNKNTSTLNFIFRVIKMARIQD